MGSRWKRLQTAGEPRRFALYLLADLAFLYRLNAVCSLFPLRPLFFSLFVFNFSFFFTFSLFFLTFF